MSIHKGDFSPAQRADVEALADRLMIPFSAAVRMLVDCGLTRVLTGETIEGALAVSSPDLEVSAEIKNTNPEEMESEEEGPGVNIPDQDLVEALRASLGIATPKSKPATKPAVEIPEPPESIDSPELRALLPDFVVHRKAIKKPIRTQAQWDYLFKQLGMCAGWQHSVLGLKYAMANGWMCMKAEYLNGKSWATIASELGLSLEAEKPAPSPADLAALDLRRAIEDARSQIMRLAPAEDGWTSYSRSIFYDHLDACKSEAEVTEHLARCRALCDRLRALGAFPLRRATQVAEILPAGTGGSLAIDLRTTRVASMTPELCPRCGKPAHFAYTDPAEALAESSICWGDTECAARSAGGAEEPGSLRPLEELAAEWRDDPPSGWVVNNPNWPAGEGEHLVPRVEGPPDVSERTVAPNCPSAAKVDGRRAVGPSWPDPAPSAYAPGITPACPDGGRHDWEPSGKCGRCGEDVGGVPYRDCNANPPAEAVEAAHSRLAEKGMLGSLEPRQLYPGHPDRDTYQAETQRRAKVADGQHAYTHNDLSGKCAWCNQPQDHIRHYLPRELPFNVEEKA